MNPGPPNLPGPSVSLSVKGFKDEKLKNLFSGEPNKWRSFESQDGQASPGSPPMAPLFPRPQGAPGFPLPAWPHASSLLPK